MGEYLPFLESHDVFDGRNVFQCFACEERLIASDEDIWKRTQPRKHVVGDD
jgi:hypothetical protein